MRQMVDRVTQRLDGILFRIMCGVMAWMAAVPERRLNLIKGYYWRFAPPIVAVGTTVGILLVFLSVGEPVGLAVVVSVVAGAVVYVGLHIALRSLRWWQ